MNFVLLLILLFLRSKFYGSVIDGPSVKQQRTTKVQTLKSALEPAIRSSCTWSHGSTDFLFSCPLGQFREIGYSHSRTANRRSLPSGLFLSDYIDGILYSSRIPASFRLRSSYGLVSRMNSTYILARHDAFSFLSVFFFLLLFFLFSNSSATNIA